VIPMLSAISLASFSALTLAALIVIKIGLGLVSFFITLYTIGSLFNTLSSNCLMYSLVTPILSPISWRVSPRKRVLIMLRYRGFNVVVSMSLNLFLWFCLLNNLPFKTFISDLHSAHNEPEFIAALLHLMHLC